MDVSNASVDLSNLIAMLEKMLESTNITKKSVSESCFEVRKLLRGWCIPNPSVLESVPPTCICFETRISNDINIEEIAKDIEDVVGNAQKLREGLGLGLRSTKTRRPSPRALPVSKPLKTCTSSSQIKPAILSKKLKHPQDLPRQSFRTNRPRPTLQSQTNASSRLRPIKPETRFNARPKPNIASNQRNTTKGMPRRSSGSGSMCSTSKQSSVSLQSTYQKDFTSSPRFSNTPTCSKVKNLAGLSTSNSGKNAKPVSATITMAQLDALLNRVSIDNRPTGTSIAEDTDSLSDTVPSMHSSQIYYKKRVNDKCLIHGKSINLKRTTSETQVDFREAINVLGVPFELVKILKPYHIFVDHLQHEEDEISKEKKVSNQFLKRINHMNESSWSETLCEPLVTLFSEYTELFRESSKITNLSNYNALNFRVKLDALEQRYRKCSNQNPSYPSESNSVQSAQVVPSKERLLSDWALAGIWNEQSINDFKVMDETLCIRYNNVQQLSSFRENMHRAQRLQYQNHTLEILRKDILPHLTNLCVHDPSVIPLFRTVAALCDLKNFTLPIFVKSTKLADQG